MSAPLNRVTKAAERLKRAEHTASSAREALHAEIYAASDAGESMSKIASAAGVSRQWVKTLLDRREADR
jgi:hypothetical protein